jgi:hypothetical protein
MANFTLETNRNTAITNIPRLTFQLPQSTTSSVPSTISPIFFCQTGCQLEFEFKNITSATLKNDGNYFTIIPNNDSNNYINWNGSGVSGQNMTRFDLKEIKFAAPARDVVGAITYNKSIQFYLTFVNSTYTNIMIVISIIGQANNVGTAQTDGFILLNALAPQIPLRNDVKTVSNLGNVNLGNLLPTNKSFFSTLLNDNNIQYIFLTRIIDIPESFLNNLISRVIGSQQAYQSKVNQYTQQIPTNPVGTIIFYTENIKPINSDQTYVCNSNCDRVVGDAKQLEPTFSSSTTARSASTGPSQRVGEVPPNNNQKKEDCKEEYVFPGTKTNVKVKSGSTPSTSADTSNQTELTSSEQKKSFNLIFYSIVYIISLIIALFFTILILVKSTINSNFSSFFSRELWLNKKNIPWIIIAFIAFIGLSICIIISLIKKDEEKYDNKPESEQKIKIESWKLILIGSSIWIFSLLILAIPIFRREFVRESRINNYGNFDNYSEIDKFETLRNKIVRDYSSNPNNFLTSSSGKSKILEAFKIYNNLFPYEKSIFDKNNPQLASLFAPNSKILEYIQSPSSSSLSATNKKDLNNLIQYFDKNIGIVTPKVLSGYEGLKLVNPNNKYLKDIENDLKLGNAIPPVLKQILDEYKKK